MKCRCGRDFEPTKPNQKHCSNACKQRAYRESKGKQPSRVTAVTGNETAELADIRTQITQLQNENSEVVNVLKMLTETMQLDLGKRGIRTNGSQLQAGWR